MTSRRTRPKSRRYDHIVPLAPSASRSAAWAKAAKAASRHRARSRTTWYIVSVVRPVGRQVAEVLVDPVRHQCAGDPLFPPGGLSACRARHACGRVPVVPDVVIVEDHRARQRREEPADAGFAPRLLVEAGVFLEVGDLLVRRPSDVAAGPDERLHRGGGVIGVHLVADQQEEFRPLFVVLAHHSVGERIEHVGGAVSAA